jgi:biopolymer transport protein ExbD
VLPISPFDEAEHRTIPASPKAPPPATGKADRGGAGEPYGEFDLNLRAGGAAAAGANAGGGTQEAPSIEVEPWDDGLDVVDDGEGNGKGHGNGDGDGHDDEEEYDPLEEDEAVAEFTLSRGSAGKVEELDLAAMVDVAFQLVLFFLVTATTVLYKTLEVPKPNPESSATAPAAQGRSKTLDDLKDDFILVEIDPVGAVKIDRDPVPALLNVLVERLRSERERTGRKAMLLSADFSTPHKSAVLAYDAANEIGMGIAIARPKPEGQ